MVTHKVVQAEAHENLWWGLAYEINRFWFG